LYQRYFPDLSRVRMRAGARELDRVEVAGFIELFDADGTTTRVELDLALGAVGERDGLGFEVGAFLDAPLAGLAARLRAAGACSCDAVDGEESEVAVEFGVPG
jgi:hypothetical protein